MTTRLRHGAGRAAPIGIAVGVFGVSFGLLARTAGMGRLAPIVMSATTFAGSAQFAVVSILHAGGTVAAAVVGLLAPALLAALVVTQTFGSGRHVVLDARIAGVAVAAAALRLGAPIL